MSQLEDSVLQNMEIPADVLAYVQNIRKLYRPAHSSICLYEPESRQLVRCIRQLDREAHQATLTSEPKG